MEAINHDKSNIEFWQRDFDKVSRGNEYDKILYLFEKNHLSCLLDRLDSMSMAASVEARVPFVDHEMVEFVSPPTTGVIRLERKAISASSLRGSSRFTGVLGTAISTW